MALQKEKVLANGAVGNYWRVSHVGFERASMKLALKLDLYKDGTPGLAPLGASHAFIFTISSQELTGNLIAMAYGKIKAAVAELHTPISGHGDPASLYPDLLGATDV